MADTADGVPAEFTPQHIKEKSPREAQLYTRFLRCGEPYKSLYKRGVHMFAKDGFAMNPAKVGNAGPTPGLDLTNPDLYYNTWGGAAEYWKGHNLPKPTKDIQRLRADLRDWGYCLISEALSAEQYARMRKRVSDQAAGEQAAGVASWMGSAPAPGRPMPNTQFIHQLMNKGEQFRQCVEHDPAGVQAGPLIEQLLTETMGKDFLMSSFLAIIAHKHGLPQGLHQDQGCAPISDANLPLTVNTMYILDDMTAENGGTLVVPGSHRIISDAGSGNPVGPLPPAINLEAPGGTVMIFEGRLLHGTGVNKTDRPRKVLVMNSVKPWMRTQEIHLLSADAEWLKKASPKLLYRIGLQPMGLGWFEGAGHGDVVVQQRLALESGKYIRIGELSPDLPEEELAKDFTYRQSKMAREQEAHQPAVLPGVRERLAARASAAKALGHSRL